MSAARGVADGRTTWHSTASVTLGFVAGPVAGRPVRPNFTLAALTEMMSLDAASAIASLTKGVG